MVAKTNNEHEIEKLLQELLATENDIIKHSYTASVDFSSMYPSIIRLLNAGIETLVGFLDDDPLASRNLKSKSIFNEEMLKKGRKDVLSQLGPTRYEEFVDFKSDMFVSLRKHIYDGAFDGATIEDIAETPFEKYFLARMGIFDENEVTMKFEGVTYTVKELYDYFEKMDYAVSGAGAVFSKKVQALIPSYLEFLYDERKITKKKMAFYEKHAELAKIYLKLKKDDSA